MARDGEVKQRQDFYNHGDTICHPKSGYVTNKLHGTSTCRCNNNAIFSDRAIFKFPVVYLCRPRSHAGHVNLAVGSIGSSCQTVKMTALLNSLFFVFKISFLIKYRVIYYDYNNKLL